MIQFFKTVYAYLIDINNKSIRVRRVKLILMLKKITNRLQTLKRLVFNGFMITCILNFVCPALYAQPVKESHHSNLKPKKMKAFFNHTPLSELVQSGLEITLTSSLLLFGHSLFGDPTPSFGVPQEGSIDLRFSRWSGSDFQAQKQWLGGVPDLMGYIVPATAWVGYGVGSLMYPSSSLWPYRFFTFNKGVFRALGLTVFLKYSIGRARPFVARSDIQTHQVPMKSKEYFLSFPSGHSAAIVSSTTLIALDLSHYLVHTVWKNEPAWKRTLLGKGLPYLGALATSLLVMYSRVKDQRHWLSDVMMGGGIGFMSAWLTFHFDFDEQGLPR